ncbi:MAG: hypothetical protein EOO56_19860 [Hymenobacter sp.]|nr:MAG: hypothetical protein EOO56_19860 [Hymenobacter sp.]
MNEEQELPQGWALETVDGVVSYPSLSDKKVKQSDYLASGKFPIIDQGKTFIAGYTDTDLTIADTPPFIVFGDHTRAFK